MQGYVHSCQSLGAADGPGVRFVAFLSGCPLRCGYCHNPDTWEKTSGELKTSDDIVKKAARYMMYYGEKGGITVSGGEPLCQAEFVCEIFKKCKEIGISTALDTSGFVYNDAVDELLSYTDTVLLDYKMANAKDYKKYTLCEKEKVDFFLKKLEEKGKDTWIRRVIVCGINDDKKSIDQLKEIKKEYSCIKKIELLPFRKLCSQKYENLGLEFPFFKYPETSKEKIDALCTELSEKG